MLLLHQAHMLSTKFADMMFAFTCDPGELRSRFCWVGQISLGLYILFSSRRSSGKTFCTMICSRSQDNTLPSQLYYCCSKRWELAIQMKLGHVNLLYFWNCCSNTSGAPKVAALNPCLYLIDWGSWELICYLYMKYVCNLQGQM